MALIRQRGYRRYGDSEISRRLWLGKGAYVTPVFMYLADRATNAVGWAPTAGATTLAEAGGAIVFGDVDSPLGTADTNCDFAAASARFDGSGTSVYDITTGDLAFELVFKTDPTGGTQQGILAKAVFSGGSIRGYTVYYTSADKVRLHLCNVASGTAADVDSAAQGTSEWHHVMFFVDASEASTNGSQCYIDGERSGAGVDCSAVGSLTNTGTFRLGVEADTFGSNFSGKLAMCAAWDCATEMPGGASNLELWDRIARERYLAYTLGEVVGP